VDGSEQTRRQQILDAALRVFAREGYHKATIRQIALEAGLKSPPLVYWYFKDKNELFEAVLLELAPLLRQIDEIASSIDDPPRVVLPRIILAYAEAVRSPDFERLFRIFLSEVGHTPGIGVHLMRGGLLALVQWLASYFARQVQLGVLRPHDPKVSAYAFVGLMGSYILGRDILQPSTEDLPDVDAYFREATALFLDGLENRAEEPVIMLAFTSTNTPNRGEGGRG
jgi:TetR/AcrR family transcriptional regulator, regulator of autoinduction and epiphytic fitness